MECKRKYNSWFHVNVCDYHYCGMDYMELMKERGEAFPVLYQEAICLFFAAVQKDPEAFRSFPISQEVQNRFLQFMKVARSMPPAALKQQFGDTYYYYAQFIPTPKRQ